MHAPGFLAAAFFAIVFCPALAAGSSIQCPGSTVSDGDHQFVIETSPQAICRSWESGNLAGSDGDIGEAWNFPEPFFLTGSGTTAFELPAYAGDGPWSISSNELSHANLSATGAVDAGDLESLVAIPEPASLLLFGSGFLLLLPGLTAKRIRPGKPEA